MTINRWGYLLASALALAVLAAIAPTANAKKLVEGTSAPGPDRFDRVTAWTYGPSKAKTVLIIVPGTSAGGKRKVVLGGHSRGASQAAAYAAWDFGGRPGYRDLAGLGDAPRRRLNGTRPAALPHGKDRHTALRPSRQTSPTGACSRERGGCASGRGSQPRASCPTPG